MKKLLALWFVLLLVLAALPVTVLANSAEPPGLIIIATDLPQDAQLTLECSGAETDPYYRSYRVNKLWESYWQFYYHWDLQENSRLSSPTENWDQMPIKTPPDWVVFLLALVSEKELGKNRGFSLFKPIFSLFYLFLDI